MTLRPIPGTALKVSNICLGTMTFGEPVGKDDAIALVHGALDRGINFIDTANMYEGYRRVIGSAGGVAETYLGEALTRRRDEIVLATKVGMKVGDQPADQGTSAAAIRKHLDLSLKRLRTDWVDIYYLHNPDPQTPLAETLGALATEISRGRIRHYGISNYSAAETRALLQTAAREGMPKPVMHQPPFSLLKPESAAELLPLCAAEGIAVAPYQVLQGGLLTGKYTRGRPLPNDSRKAEKDNWLPGFDDALFDRLEALDAAARGQGRSLFQHALRTALAAPGVVSLVLGFKRCDQVEQALAAIAD